jgi:hypothetical protein
MATEWNDPQVEERDGQTVVTVRLPWPADRCFELFAATDRLAEWLHVVGTIVVRERDERGRALEVGFTGSLERASIGYTLLYEYHDDTRELRWTHAGGGPRVLSGWVRFTPEGPGACRLEYALTSELPPGLPPWADHFYAHEPAETVVLDFCTWLEEQLGAEPATR